MASSHSLQLFSQILVLHSEQLVLPVQVEHDLILLVHLDHRLVLDVHCSRRITERIDRLFVINFEILGFQRKFGVNWIQLKRKMSGNDIKYGFVYVFRVPLRLLKLKTSKAKDFSWIDCSFMHFKFPQYSDHH